MAYGNAVERLVAQHTNPLFDPLTSQILRHVGGPNRPDFVGIGRAAGQQFDITTPLQINAHLARPYGRGLNISTYTRPGSFTVFP
jgi:hypothetical protein